MWNSLPLYPFAFEEVEILSRDKSIKLNSHILEKAIQNTGFEKGV